MSRSKHRQQPNAHQWNPPPLVRDLKSPLCPEQNVASATECTGLEIRPVVNEVAAESYTDLYSIHEQKTQGNIGKGNPRNDPDEIRFHRT